MRVLRISHSAVVTAWRQRERELRRLGLDVSVLSAREWDEGGAPVRLRPDAGEPVTPVRTFGRHPNVFVYDPRPLWRALGRPWDVLDIHEEPCSLATAEVLALRFLRRRRQPYVLYSAQNIEKRYPAPFRWWEQWALRGAAGVSVCNVAAGRILRGKGLRTRARYVPLGVDTQRFVPAERRPPTDAVTVGYVGRLDEHKGVHVLIDAVAADARLRLVVVGGGPGEAELRRRVAASGVAERVRFRGHCPADQLPHVYREFDVVAVPSLPTPSWLEQFCRVAVEAMSSGVPVVASDTGAIPDVVGDAGVLVPPGDPTALSAALSHLGSDPDRWSQLRTRGIERSRRFAWPAVAAAQNQLYAEATGEHTGEVPAHALETPESQPVEVIVVAYGSPDLLESALEPLAGEFAITVVDNSSSLPTRRVVEHAGGRYVDPGRNLGFGAGVNHALAHRQCPDADVLLLNPDARISADDVRRLHKSLRADPTLACVGPAQVDADGTPATVGWPFPSPQRAWAEAVGLGRLGRRTDFVIGSVLLITRAALDAVGGFDERFFLYAEETDWQRRARHAGFGVAIVPEVTASHIGAATSGDPSVRETHFHASLEAYTRKHFGRLGWLLFRVAGLGGSSARSVLLAGEKRSTAKRRLRLYARGPMRSQRRLLAGAQPRR